MIRTDDIEFESMKFSGGEWHIQITTPKEDLKNTVRCRVDIHSADDAMEFLMFCSAVEKYYGRNKVLEVYMPYMPYSRQDRVCAPGQENGFSEFNHSFLFNSAIKILLTLDIHNEKVLPYSMHSISQVDYFNIMGIIGEDKRGLLPIIVRPDDGAENRVGKISSFVGGSGIKHGRCRFRKSRDPNTGHIVMSNPVHSDDSILPSECNYFIFDDICDGGMTFILIAKKLREIGAGKITLVVSHGIFSKGLDVFDGLIDRIYCSDSFPHKSHGILTVLDKNGEVVR